MVAKATAPRRENVPRHILFSGRKEDEQSKTAVGREPDRRALPDDIEWRHRRSDGVQQKENSPGSVKGQAFVSDHAYRGTQVFHENHTAEETAAILEADLSGSFKQLQVETTSFEATVLVSKKGKMTVRKKQRSVSEDNVKVSLSHNRKKRYILEEGRPVPFLVDLGVQTKEGKVITSRYDKFRQINRFLEFIEDIWPLLPKDRPVHIIDFGCGKSYLTFAMYYYLHELKGLTLEVTGL